eukprot:2351779-Prymnesium_polylepis.2
MRVARAPKVIHIIDEDKGTAGQDGIRLHDAAIGPFAVAQRDAGRPPLRAADAQRGDAARGEGVPREKVGPAIIREVEHG